MGALITTLWDISLLRKGPDAIPASWLPFAMAIVLRGIAVVLSVAFIETFTLHYVKIDLVVWTLGLVFFSAIVVITGKGARLSQTLTALVGIGALITFAVLAVRVLGARVLPEATVLTISLLLLLWSVVIKGHIMARALDWHWYLGFILSLVVFLVQWALVFPDG